MIAISVSKLTPDVGVGQTPTKSTVTDVTTEIVPSNAKRISLYLVNIGDFDVWISYDVDAQFERGSLLGKMGGSVLIDAANLTTGSVNGICKPLNTSEISLQELIRS